MGGAASGTAVPHVGGPSDRRGGACRRRQPSHRAVQPLGARETASVSERLGCIAATSSPTLIDIERIWHFRKNGPSSFAGGSCKETCCQQTCGISSQWHERVCGPVENSKHLGCTDHSRFPLLRPLLRKAADRRKMQGQPAGVSISQLFCITATLESGIPLPADRRHVSLLPPSLQSYQRGRQS